MTQSLRLSEQYVGSSRERHRRFSFSRLTLRQPCLESAALTSSATRGVDRYYDPATDQFLSVDPDVAETGQPYAFVGDDPVNASDPLGNIFEADGYTGGTVQALGTTVTAAEAAETFSGASGTASGPASTPYKSLQVNHSTTQHDDAAGPQNSFIQYTGSCLSILFLQHCSYKITGGPTYSSFGLTTNPVPSFANQSDKIISNGPVSMCSAERYLHGFTVESQVGAGVGALGGSYGDVGSLAPGSAGISAEKGFPGFGPSGGIGYSFGPNC